MFVLSILSATMLFLVPRKMHRQYRFVAEMLMLLAVVAPLKYLIGTTGAPDFSSYPTADLVDTSSLKQFYAQEVSRRLEDMGRSAGLSVRYVKVTDQYVEVGLADDPCPEVVQAYAETASAFLAIEGKVLKISSGMENP